MSQVANQVNQAWTRCQCQHCTTVFQIGEKFVGQVVDCPKCTQPFEISALPIGLTANTPTVSESQMMVYETLARPLQVALGSWLGGPLMGGGLIAWNFTQLGKRKQAFITMLIATLVFIGVMFVAIWMMDYPGKDPSVLTTFQIIGFALMATQVTIFTLFAKERWSSIWNLEDLPPIRFQTSGKIVMYIFLGALVASVIGYFLILGAMLLLFA